MAPDQGQGRRVERAHTDLLRSVLCHSPGGPALGTHDHHPGARHAPAARVFLDSRQIRGTLALSPGRAPAGEASGRSPGPRVCHDARRYTGDGRRAGCPARVAHVQGARAPRAHRRAGRCRTQLRWVPRGREGPCLTILGRAHWPQIHSQIAGVALQYADTSAADCITYCQTSKRWHRAVVVADRRKDSGVLSVAQP